MILRWYRRNGRPDLPWRKTRDPYHILVSEIMLQQTQVDRVMEKYHRFIKRFPTVEKLARAKRSSVIKAWQGLGYNRRAIYLQQAAQEIINIGRWPKTAEALQTLSGVGPYTAAAVVVFAFNSPVTMIETNIRRVFIHHFFPNRTRVTDRQLLPLITDTLYRKNPRLWYSALMDYGAIALQHVTNPNRRSRQYTRQSPFTGSDRQIRGAIIRLLTVERRLTRAQILRRLGFAPARLQEQLTALSAEGFVRQTRQLYSLA